MSSISTTLYNSKIHLITIFILLIVVGLLTGSFVTKTIIYPILTSNWKTYINNLYKFSFKYPSDDYQLSESNLRNGDFRIYLMRTPIEQTARGITIIKGKTISDIIEEMRSNPHGEKFSKEGTVTIDGVKGKSVLIEAVKGPTKAEAFFIEKNGFVYRFDWLDSSIISTFKFLD